MPTRTPKARGPAGSRAFFVSRAALIALVVCGAFLAQACGYTLAQRRSKVPQRINRIAIPVFKNETSEPAVEDVLTDGFVQAFEHHQWVRITSVADADAVLYGTVKDFTTAPISFAVTDYAAEYRARVKLKLVLREKGGKTLWEDKKVSYSQEYRVTTDIFASEANKRRAIELLAAEFAEEIQDRIFDGF